MQAATFYKLKCNKKKLGKIQLRKKTRIESFSSVGNQREMRNINSRRTQGAAINEVVKS